MRRRENLSSKIKTVGMGMWRRAEPFFYTGAIATNLYILTAPTEVLETQTCENARAKLAANAPLLALLNAVMVKDTGIFTFFVSGAVRAINIPVGHWAYDKVSELIGAPRLSEYRQKSLKIWEDGFVQASSTGIFIAMLPLLPKPAIYSLLPIATLPIANVYFKHRFFNYPGSASLEAYREAYPERRCTVASLTAIECALSAANVGGALSGLLYYLINATWDASHQTNLSHTHELMLAAAALGAVIGAVAPLIGKRTHRAVNQGALTIDLSIMLTMLLSSVTFCFAPSLASVDSWMQQGIFFEFASFAVSTIISGLIANEIYTRAASRNEGPIVEEVDTESSPEEYITYGTIQSESQAPRGSI